MDSISRNSGGFCDAEGIGKSKSAKVQYEFAFGIETHALTRQARHKFIPPSSQGGPESGFGRSCQAVLGVPAHRAWAIQYHRRFGSSFEFDNLPCPVGLLFMAARAAKVKNLGFALRRFRLVVRHQKTAYDGGNRDRRFAMKAYHPSKGCRFDFKRHSHTSLRSDPCLGGHHNPTLRLRAGPVAWQAVLWKLVESSRITGKTHYIADSIRFRSQQEIDWFPIFERNAI
jgi:hypothetical protein